MAYLRGTTVVDGSLYVEGELNVKSVRGADGTIIPYIAEGSGTGNHLVKFSPKAGADGEQIDSYLIEEVRTETNDNVSKTGIDIKVANTEGTDADFVNILYDIEKLRVGYHELEPVGSTLDKPEAITGWKYKLISSN